MEANALFLAPRIATKDAATTIFIGMTAAAIGRKNMMIAKSQRQYALLTGAEEGIMMAFAALQTSNVIMPSSSSATTAVMAYAPSAAICLQHPGTLQAQWKAAL